MGISIHISISHSVTKEEWTAVYLETLRLVEAFPFAERRKVSVRGIDTVCLVPTRERKERYGWNNEKIRTGWFADGDYESLCTAEEYYLPRDLITDDTYDLDAPDAMFGMLPAYLPYEWKDPRFQRCYDLWGEKTQGEPYHMYLLAVACLIESRLGRKACIYGDITKGQCRKAVEMANSYLDHKIDIPARCNPGALLERVKSFPVSEQEMLAIYICLYLGNKDALFGESLRKYFSEAAFEAYWTYRFGSFQVTMRGFNDALKDYLLWGFSLEKLSGYVSFTDEEGNEYYNDYVRKIMATKLYINEKDCRDILKIDEDREEPYGVSRLFMQVALSAAANRKVDRYIPLEEIRAALLSSIGDRCDVNQLIDDYLKEEAACQKIEKTETAFWSDEDCEKAAAHDASAVLNHAMEMKRKAWEEKREQYKITEPEDLPFYEMGDTISPDLAEMVGEYFTFYRSIIKEDRFTELMNDTPKARCKWLVYQNRNILLRDKDWDRIYGDIMDNPLSFERYYPMVRVKITEDSLIYLIRAITINDDFYRYAFTLEEKYGKEVSQ